MEQSPGHREHPEHAVREKPIDHALCVEIHGEAVARSQRVIKVEEDRHPPRYYFPRADVDMAKLERTAKTSHCPFKGQATYYTITVGGATLENAAWSYEDPYEEHRALKDHLAFYDEKPEIDITALA